MESYGKNKGNSSVAGDPSGPGGVKAACAKNPNAHAELNDAPDGPYAHCMGYSGDGGMHGSQEVSGKSGKFYIR